MRIAAEQVNLEAALGEAADLVGGIGLESLLEAEDGQAPPIQAEYGLGPPGFLAGGPGSEGRIQGEAGPAQLLLTENDGQVVSGIVTGSVTITPSSGDPPETRQGSFQARFHIESEGAIPGGGFTAHACTVVAP